MLRPLSLMKEVLFRFAFGVCILVQIVLWFLLLGGISALFASDKYFLQGIIVILVFAGLLPIGAANYFLYHRIIREEYICTESEKWLAERRRANSSQVKRTKWLKHWLLWIPSVTVVLACVFMDGGLAVMSHLFHPDSFKLIGFRVSIPIDWNVGFGQPFLNGSQTWSLVTAN